MVYDPRFGGGIPGPGRPTGTGVPAPKPPSPAQPQVPTVAQNPIGRPPGPIAPKAPGPGAWSGALTPAPKFAAANPNPAQTGTLDKVAGMFGAAKTAAAPPAQTGTLDKVASAGKEFGFGAPATAATPPQVQASATTPTPGSSDWYGTYQPKPPAPPTQVASSPTPTSTTPPVASTPPPAPTTIPSVTGGIPPTMNPVNPTQAPAPAIGTPPTPTSSPIGNSPWKYEQTWGALGDLGDQQLDSAVKKAALDQLQNNPFGDKALAQENARSFDLTAAQKRASEEALGGDLARRGLTRSGVGAELGAEVTQNAANSYATGARENAINMREKAASYGANALKDAQGLASDLASRGVDLENLRMQREGLAQQIAAQNRGGGGGNDNLVTIMNPDGTESQVDLRLLDLVLGMEEGGMWG